MCAYSSQHNEALNSTGSSKCYSNAIITMHHGNSASLNLARVIFRENLGEEPLLCRSSVKKKSALSDILKSCFALVFKGKGNIKSVCNAIINNKRREQSQGRMRKEHWHPDNLSLFRSARPNDIHPTGLKELADVIKAPWAIISENSWRVEEWKRIRALAVRRAKEKSRESQISPHLSSGADQMKGQFTKQAVEAS